MSKNIERKIIIFEQNKELTVIFSAYPKNCVAQIKMKHTKFYVV